MDQKYFPQVFKKAVSICSKLFEISEDKILSKSEEMDYNFHLAKVCCILCDYFKTEGLNPESYLNEVTRYKREER